jgi:hypothetical protein
MSELHAKYLHDLGHLLREQATAAARDRGCAKGTDDAAFQSGRAFAFYEVISLLVQQAEAFGLPLADIACESFEPERLLE